MEEEEDEEEEITIARRSAATASFSTPRSDGDENVEGENAEPVDSRRRFKRTIVDDEDD